MKHNMMQNRANARALQGVLYATLAPVGWLLIQASMGVDPVVEVARAPGFYVYQFGVMALMLGVGGYVIGRQDQRLIKLTQTDFLTHVRNRAYFHTRLKEQHALARRQDHPLGVLAVDVDYFSTVNQSFGRGAGDSTLGQVAEAIEGALRQGETLARMGDDRFAVILHQCTSGQARLVGERVGQAVSDLRITLERGMVIGATVSVGAASTDMFTGCDAEALMDQAYFALEVAKENGRGGTHVAEGGGSVEGLEMAPLGVIGRRKDAA